MDVTSARADSEVSLAPTMLRLLGGAQITQAISVMARLDIAGMLREGPLFPDEIAGRCDANPSTLLRLLRALATIDLVREDASGRFSATALGVLLRDDHSQSLRAAAIGVGDRFTWDAWGDLYGSVTTGECAFERVNGMSSFAWMASRPELFQVFHDTMTAFSRNDLPAILETYDFGSSRLIVDVAGGQGELLRGILHRYPDAHGILYELPNVIADPRQMAGTPEADRCVYVGGDMFESVPAGGDTYLFKLILHDWDDAHCVQLLRNCRAAIAPGGRILVIDLVLQPPGVPDPGTWADLHMMVMCGGKERTRDEFAALFSEAGFELVAVHAAGATAIVEGRPV
ncbi:MAG: methyltransferase [Thermomicrobiales bacterium]